MTHSAEHNGRVYGTGAVRSPKDERDYKWEEIGHGSMPFDWTKPYDIETLTLKYPTKDQGQSGSCGGQAWSYYDAVLEYLNSRTFEERSARFIYSQTFVPGGGSAGRANSEILRTQGDAREAVFTSYENGQAPTEMFMEKHSDITDKVRADAKGARILAYASVPVNVDTIAQAIRDFGGVVLGVAGTNNGTWLSPNPKHPKSGEQEWYHWLYAGKARTHNGIKQIGVHNSWGMDVGESGWQWLDEDYFVDAYIFEVWTMVFNPEPISLTFHHTFNIDLQQGMTSPEVLALQTALQIDGSFSASLKPTGYFGTATLAAVKHFQKRNTIAGPGDTGYGRVGPKTRAALNQIYG